MSWETPSFVEIKMDAEINSYQDDFANIPDIEQPSAEGAPGDAPIATSPK
jgi:coenzyme PQQ precursor peptide PqqA